MDTTRPRTLAVLVLMPWARAMLWLAPVARRAEPCSVPKNQYSSAITAAVSSTSSSRGLFSAGSRT